MKMVMLLGIALSFSAFAGNPSLPKPRPAKAVRIVDTLFAGQSLGTYGQLASANGQYILTVQNDGNVVIWGPSGVKWSSWFGKPGTTPPPGYGQKVVTNFTIQADGNLVGYGPGAPWSSESWGFGGANTRVTMQNDGNLVVYQGSRPLWASLQGNFVRWDNQLQGCFATMNDGYQGICFSGNTARAIVLPPGSPVYFRCGILNTITVYQSAAESKVFGYVGNGGGGLIPPTQSPNALCEPLQSGNPFIVSPAFSNQSLEIPFIATNVTQTNGNAVSTMDGLYTTKAGNFRRVAGIPGL